MAFKFLTVPIQDTSGAAGELNGFLSSHRVLSVDRRWVEQGASSFWSFCIDYLDGASSAPPGDRRNGPPQRGKGVDYKEVLNPDDFRVFAGLRDLRKEIAQAEAVPVYTIFTNEQLAEMVKGRATTKTALEKIAGIGDARLEKYGARFLERLACTWKNGDEASQQPV